MYEDDRGDDDDQDHGGCEWWYVKSNKIIKNMYNLNKVGFAFY